MIYLKIKKKQPSMQQPHKDKTQMDFSLTNTSHSLSSDMEATASSIVLSLALAAFLTCAWKLVNWVWLRPKQLERCLRDQGFKGNPYRFLYGDSKEFASMIKEAKSKTMEASDDNIVPRVIPFHQYFINRHGTYVTLTYSLYCSCYYRGPKPSGGQIRQHTFP